MKDIDYSSCVNKYLCHTCFLTFYSLPDINPSNCPYCVSDNIRYSNGKDNEG